MTEEVTKKPKRKKLIEKKPGTERQSIPQDRTCLMCRRMFWSDGPGNRVCSSCKCGDAWTRPSDMSITRPR